MGIQPAGIVQTPPTDDQANAVVASAVNGALPFTGAGQQSPSFLGWGTFNVVFGGPNGPNGAWTGTIRLERSFDGGVTWYVCSLAGGTGGQAVWTAPPSLDVSLTVGETERGVLYRLNCTAFGAGPINYRFSQTGAVIWQPPGAP